MNPAGTQDFLNAAQNYPLLLGSQSNTFKCFVISVATWNCQRCGVQASFTMTGCSTTPMAGSLRACLIPTAASTFSSRMNLSFSRGLNDHGRMRFEVSVYGHREYVPCSSGRSLTSFWPTTIDVPSRTTASGAVEGRKNDQENGTWRPPGHGFYRSRRRALWHFRTALRCAGTPPLEARLPQLQAREFVAVSAETRAVSEAALAISRDSITTLGTCGTRQARSRTALITTSTLVSLTISWSWIISGPHFSIANPFFKTPRAVCTANGALRSDRSYGLAG